MTINRPVPEYDVIREIRMLAKRLGKLEAAGIPGSGSSVIPGTGGGHEIQDEGLILPDRSDLNFQGGYITASDDVAFDRTNVQVDVGPDLAALDSAGSSTDTFPYYTGTGSASLASLTAFARQINAAASAAAVRTLLGIDTDDVVLFGEVQTSGNVRLGSVGPGLKQALLLGLDTSIYRDAADTLRTADSLVVDGNLTVGGSSLATMLMGTRVVRGVVNADGTVDLGTGFTVAKVGTGRYTISFNSPFTTTPVVEPNPLGNLGGSGGDNTATIDNQTAWTPSQVGIATTVNGALTDLKFVFVATAVDSEKQQTGPGALPAARVYMDTNLGAVAPGSSILTWNAEASDSDGMHDTAANTGRLTCQTAGTYVVGATLKTVAAAPSDGSWIGIKITRIAGGGIEWAGYAPLPSGHAQACVSAVLDLNVGDYVEINFANLSSGSITPFGSTLAGGASTFWAAKTGAGWVLDKPYFRASRTAALVTDASSTVIVFSNEELDPNGWYNPATGKFQPTRPGVYEINWMVGIDTILTVDNYFQARAYKNGVFYRSAPFTFQRGGSASLASGNKAIVTMNGTTDFIEIRASSNEGTPGTTTLTYTADAGYTFFEGRYIGAL